MPAAAAALFTARRALARPAGLRLGHRDHQRPAGVEARLRDALPLMRPRGLRLAPNRTAPRQVTRAGHDVVELFLAFETATGSAEGVARLMPDAGGPGGMRAWILLTALQELRGHPDRAGRQHTVGEGLLPRLRRPQLGRQARGRPRLCRPRPGGHRRRLRPGGAGHRRAARRARHRHAGGGPGGAGRRQLAPPLPFADAAQRGACQPPALHALPADLAGLHPEGHAGQLVRGLCRGAGAECLDRHRAGGRRVGRSGAMLAGDRCGAPMAARG